jgi:hypothetical protein
MARSPSSVGSKRNPRPGRTTTPSATPLSARPTSAPVKPKGDPLASIPGPWGRSGFTAPKGGELVVRPKGDIATVGKTANDTVQEAMTQKVRVRGGPGPSGAWLDWRAPTAPAGADAPERRLGFREGTFAAPSTAPTFASGADKTTSARFIILGLGVGGATIMLTGHAQATTTADGKQVPGNLRAFAGLLVAGSVALIANEVSPTLGLMFGVSLFFVALGDGKILLRISDALFGKQPTIRSGGTVPLTTPAQPPATSAGQSPSLGHTVM